jgi:hypothetical protein
MRATSSAAVGLHTVRTHPLRIASSSLSRWRPIKVFSTGRKMISGRPSSGRASASSTLATATASTAGRSGADTPSVVKLHSASATIDAPWP